MNSVRSSVCGDASTDRDWWVAFAAVLILADAFDGALYATFGIYAQLLPGVPLHHVLLVPACAAAGWLLAGHLRAAVDHARAAWPVWPAVALAFVSSAWSAAPVTTFCWATVLLAVSAFGIILAIRYSPHAQAVLVADAGMAVALASAGAVLLLGGRAAGGSTHGTASTLTRICSAK